MDAVSGVPQSPENNSAAAWRAPDQLVTNSSLSRLGIRLGRNREAQRRLRCKQQAHENYFEAQLNETTVRLHQLEEHKKKLEARNALLEKISYLNAKVSALPDQDGTDRQPVSLSLELEASSHLFLSLAGKPRAVVTEEVQRLSLAELSTIWTEYMYEIGACLLQLDIADDADASTRLHKLTSEAMNLIATRTRLDRSVLNAVMHQDVLTLSSLGHDPFAHKLDGAFYTQILTMWNLSEDQTADLLHLRKLYLTRRCVLSLERKAIIRRLSQIDCHILNPTSCMAELQDLTGALQQNAAEDYQMYYKVARSVYRGVLSIRQVAGLLVQAYPFVSSMEPVLELLALKWHEPTMDDIVMAAEAEPMTAEWDQFTEYYMIVGAMLYPDYLPISTCPLAT
ncbi:hypothetical protein WJX82_006916 [Trebouxia sp. C0006]